MFKRKKQPEMYIPPELQAYYAPEIKAQKRSNKKRILITVASLLAVIAIGVGVGLFLSSNRSDPIPDTTQQAQPAEDQATPKPAQVPATPEKTGVTDRTVEQP